MVLNAAREGDSLSVVMHPADQALGRLKLKCHESETSLRYTESISPDRVHSQDPVSKNERRRRRKLRKDNLSDRSKRTTNSVLRE